MLTLTQALSVLAKSSPFSVKTLSDRQKDELDEFKDWLFVEQSIETDLRGFLNEINSKKIVFLCGSSGDGKSEILARCYDKFREKFDFHLDATHSFAPDESAIQTLDKTFDAHAKGSRPLVVGINIGMLANYANEGNSRHDEIKKSINRFLEKKLKSTNRSMVDGPVHYLDFEQYPRFHFPKIDGTYSTFTHNLFQNLTSKDPKNPFFQAEKYERQSGNGNTLVLTNYKILSLASVQEMIITQLLKARLIKDQFITVRALLDLIHHLILGPGYIFDNLYVGDDNELVNRLAEFDPAKIHTRELDELVLKYELQLPDVALKDFLTEATKYEINLEFRSSEPLKAASLIRLFSLIKDEEFGNNYHHKFRATFKETSLEKFIEAWTLHKEFDSNPERRIALRRFYQSDLILGFQKYANRNAPELINTQNELYLNSFGSVMLTAPIDLKPEHISTLDKNGITNTSFTAYIKNYEKSIKPIVINYNLFELLQKLKDGYHPNKYDKNSIVLLEEIIDQIVAAVKVGSHLKFYDTDYRYTVKEEEGMFVINEVR